MDTTAIERPRGRDLWQVPRTKGAMSGLLLILLGLWGALIPFVGPYFDFGFTTDAWEWTANRFLLSVLPGIVAIVGGLILMTSGNRATASLGAILAIIAGVWYVVGPPLSDIWDPGALGVPLGGQVRQAAIMISFFFGLGALMIFLGAGALGRLSVVGMRDVATARSRRLGREEPGLYGPGRHEPERHEHGRHARTAGGGHGRFGGRRHAPAGADRYGGQAEVQPYPDEAAYGQRPAPGGRPSATTPQGHPLDESSVYPDEPRRPDERRHPEEARYPDERGYPEEHRYPEEARRPDERGYPEEARYPEEHRPADARHSETTGRVPAGSGGEAHRRHWWERSH